MPRRLKNISLILLVAVYFVASQATVIAIVSAWYSTTDKQAVSKHDSACKDPGELAWTPRSHLPFALSQELSPAQPSGNVQHPALKSYRLVRIEQPRIEYDDFYFTGLCNKAPPTA